VTVEECNTKWLLYKISFCRLASLVLDDCVKILAVHLLLTVYPLLYRWSLLAQWTSCFNQYRLSFTCRTTSHLKHIKFLYWWEIWTWYWALVYCASR